MHKKIFHVLIFTFCAFLLITYFFIVTYAEERIKIEKVEDVIVVDNPKNPTPKNGLKKRIVFKEELSIGLVEGDENYMFGSAVTYNTDEEGNFYVTDWDTKRIQKFDPEGKYLLTIGRKGRGPGEFRNLSVVRFDKDNNITS